MTEPCVVSFFAGAGGLDLGFEHAGLAPDVAVEINPWFVQTLRNNRPATRVLQADVTTMAADDVTSHLRGRDVTCVIGGPPCQSFCTGGKRAALHDPRGNLIVEYLRLIGELKPRFFVLENVANLVTAAISHRPIAQRPGQRWNLSSYSTQNQLASEHPPLTQDEMSGSAARYVVELLKDTLGYEISMGIVDAADHGAPQHRLRFILIGSRDAKAPALPRPRYGQPHGYPYQTVRDAIADLADHAGPGSQYTAMVRDVFRQVPPGGNWRCLPPDVARKALGERSYAAGGGKTGFFRRLSWDMPAPTITGAANRKGSALCHPHHTRPLSVRECARIQGFPDDWMFAGSQATQYLQVGNAVPVQLGHAVGEVLRQAIDGTCEIETRDAATMLSDSVTRLRSAAKNKRRSRVHP